MDRLQQTNGNRLKNAIHAKRILKGEGKAKAIFTTSWDTFAYLRMSF